VWNPLRLFVPGAGAAPAEAITDEAESYSLSDDAVLQAFYGALSRMSSSGIRVTQETAFRSVAVLACLIVRSETFATLPVDVLRGPDGAAEQAHEEPAYRILAISPHELMTAPELWRWKQIRQDVSGNAYMRIEWGKAYKPAAIFPLTGPNPRLVIDRATRRAAYAYTGDDFTPAGPIAPRDILHFKGSVLRTPYEGASLIDLASEAIGVSIGSEQFFARLLGNGTHFPGYLETDTVLTKEDFDAVADQLKGYAGLFAAGELRIFDRGLKYKQNSMSVKDAALIEQQRWELQQICSVFRVPMAAVQDLTNGTYSNTEQQDVALGKHTVTPICKDTEAVLRMRLFDGTPGLYAKWNLDGLLRGDYKTRTEGDATLVRAGIINRNEARGHYDKNRVPGLDTFLAELSLGAVSEDGTITGPDKGSDPAAVDAAAAPAPGARAELLEPAAAILEPLRADAVQAIRRRAASDSARGRSLEETIAFALVKLEPLADAHAAAGVPFNRRAFATDALELEPATGDGSGTIGAEGETEPVRGKA